MDGVAFDAVAQWLSLLEGRWFCVQPVATLLPACLPSLTSTRAPLDYSKFHYFNKYSSEVKPKQAAGVEWMQRIRFWMCQLPTAYE